MSWACTRLQITITLFSYLLRDLLNKSEDIALFFGLTSGLQNNVRAPICPSVLKLMLKVLQLPKEIQDLVALLRGTAVENVKMNRMNGFLASAKANQFVEDSASVAGALIVVPISCSHRIDQNLYSGKQLVQLLAD